MADEAGNRSPPPNKTSGASRAAEALVADWNSEDDSDDYDDLLFAERQRRGGTTGEGPPASHSIREDVM